MPGLHYCQDSMRQDENKSVNGTFVSSHTLNLFSSRLEALRDMLVNQSRVEGNENVSNALPCYQRFSHKSVNVYICVYFISFTPR